MFTLPQSAPFSLILSQMVPATRRRATLRTMLAVSDTVRLCYECVLLPRPQTNHSQLTLLLAAAQSLGDRQGSAGMHEQEFDICYVMADESLSFRKYPALHELEEHHGVDLGFAYNTEVSAQTFIHYIAESQHQSFLDTFSKLNFYSCLMDASTDAGNVEDELVLIQYCTQDDPAQEIRSCKPILIGGGTDGASVNIAEQSGMKGKLQKQLPWLHWT